MAIFLSVAMSVSLAAKASAPNPGTPNPAENQGWCPCQMPEEAFAQDSGEPPSVDATAMPRGRIERTSWLQLPEFANDGSPESLDSFSKSCTVLGKLDEWRTACSAAFEMVGAKEKPNRAAVVRFFYEHFEPFRIINPDETDGGIVTGYYEPLLHGSLKKTARFRYPLYRQPDSLVSVDLTSVYPDLNGRRLRGRLSENRLIPYFTREEIESRQEPLKGWEMVWVDDPVEAHYLQIQGSGQIRLTDGSMMRVGYAEQNGHPFRSLAAALIRNREIRAHQASLPGIKEWARRHPGKWQRYLKANPSYVFFRELPRDLPGPLGSLGVPLTAERSIAVDRRVIPLGVPVYVATTWPGTSMPMNRLVVAQDTGGAINGAVRADYFWGYGDEAGRLAGRMKQSARMWMLLPRGYEPEDLRKPPSSGSLQKSN